jgi:hypothetical protein
MTAGPVVADVGDRSAPPKKKAPVLTKPKRFVWIRCARRCGWRVKIRISAFAVTLCPDCAAERRLTYVRGYGWAPTGVTIERFVSR